MHFSTINFPLSTALAACPVFWYVIFSYTFSSVDLLFPLRFLLSPMNCWELCCVISKGLEIILLSFCYWFVVWFHYGLCMVSILLNWLRFVLWHRKCSTLMNIPWAWKKVSSAVTKWSFLYMSMRSVLFISSRFFLMFCLVLLTIAGSGMFKFSAAVVFFICFSL